MTVDNICLVCSEPTKKYKCSKCFNYCCSLPCYKSHQANAKCVQKPAQTELITIDPVPDASQRLQMFTTDDTVATSKLEELAHSERLKSLLRNPHLRDFLVQLDTTPDAWKAMKVAMLEPLFVEFANECLAVVEPDTDAESPPSSEARSEAEQIVNDFCVAAVSQMEGEGSI